MKKIFALLLIAPLIVSLTFLASCPNTEDDSDTASGSSSSKKAIEFKSLRADGSSRDMTVKLTLTFDDDITGLNADDITLIDNKTGIIKETFIRTDTGVYQLDVSGINANGRITVNVSKRGYKISGGPKNVSIYVGAKPADYNTWGEWLAFKYNKSFGYDAANMSPLKGDITHNMLAEEFFFSKGLNAGWNLGNTYELSSNPKYETGNYETLFAGVKAAGINVVRIPVTWGGDATGKTTITRKGGSTMSVAGPNTIVSASVLDSLEKAVTAAHNAGITVFINTHHDKGFFSLDAAGEDFTENGADGANFKTITAGFRTVWTQIANRFKDYGDWLIFEGMNEPTYSTGTATNWDGAPPEYHEVLNQWFQSFVEAVRATSPDNAPNNNAKRYLIIKSYAAKLQTSLNPVNGFRMPADPAGPGRLCYSFHSYVPQPLGLEGQETNWTPSHVGQYTSMFEQASDAYIKQGIPVFMGETGATFHSQRTGEDAITANKNRILLLNALGYKAREFGVIPCLWDNGEATRTNSSQPNGETFAMFRRKAEHSTKGGTNSDPGKENYGKPIDHTLVTVPPNGVGNPAYSDRQFGEYTVKAFIDAVNGRKALGSPDYTDLQKTQL